MKINQKKDNMQVIFNILSQVVLNGVNFVLIMLFTHYLTTSNYGIVSIYQAYVLFFAILVGLNSQGSIGPAFVHIEKENRNNYLASIMLLAVLSFFVFIFIFTILMPTFSQFAQMSPLLIYLMIVHSFGNFCFNFANVKNVYSQKAQFSFFMSIFIALLMIIFAWIGVYYQNNKLLTPYLVRILGLALPYILCGIYVVFITFIKGNPFCILKRAWKFCLPICIPLIFHGVSQVILAQTDKIMLQKLVTEDSEVGVYSFISTFVHILNAIYVALNNTWVPLYYSYIKENKKEILLKRSKRYNDLFSILVAGFIMVSPEFVKWFSDVNYWKGILLIPLISLSIYMVFLYSFAVNYEIYYTKTKLIAVGTLAAAISNIILNIFMIPYLGMYGAGVATLIAYILLFLFHERCAKKISNNMYPYTKKFFIKNTLGILVFCIIFYLFLEQWYIRWIIAIILGIILIYKIRYNKVLF